MFLAWKEIKYNKARFALVISLIVLITYLVYFLIALAYGLASSYTNVITTISPNNIILSDDSNDNVMMSMLDNEIFDNLELEGEKAKLGIFPAIVILNQNDTNILETKEEVYVFGIEDLKFFIPNSKTQLNDNEIIVDNSLQKKGYEIGDYISISGTKIKWKIVGFTNKMTFQTAPVMFVNLNNWQEYRFNNTNTNLYNTIWVKGKITNLNNNLTTYTTNEYANTLPGYTAQVLTFSLMIGFLIVIIAFVLGIFIYVLTIQKSNMFGVMKAQGISSRYIGNSVISQTIILVTIGAAIGFLLTTITGLLLTSKVPFANNFILYTLVTIAFYIFTIIGALFSYKAVVKIDPVKAIG